METKDTATTPTAPPARDWSAFQQAEPQFAALAEARFKKYKHHVLGTLRKDGSPRVTGLEVDFRDGELLLGMMPGSMKALDLLRDPRFSVQANPGPDAEMADGDVRVSGRAVRVTDPAALASFVAQASPPEPFLLFRVEPTEVVYTGIENDEMVVRVWRPGTALRTLRRGNGAESVREDA
ncbi:pyridoxamine 5'-phosphate oxidase family protein [Streptomyces xanthochromogenes]|uniref:pyridoxamine 5'-phosphate oxidase family protein n=1 Tax=Streptomyces xanthochromogenes TaxID=67384 RepID=UPI00342FFA97